MKLVVNLLPPVYRRQQLLRRRAFQWGSVACLVLFAAWVAHWYKLGEFQTLSQQLEAVAREGRPAQTMLREITSMRRKIQQLQQHEAIAKELEQQRQVLSVLGLISGAAKRSGGKLRITDFQATNLQATPVEGATSTDETHAAKVTLIGVSLDSPAVAEFHDALLKSGMFGDVKFVKSNERQENGLAVYDYEVCCEL